MSADLARIYTFAVWMTGSRAEGQRRAAEVVRAAPTIGFEGWVKALLEPLAGRQAPQRPDRRDVLSALDDLLRTDLTVTAGDHPQIQRDPRRLRVLQWHLKRSCLFSVMRGVAITPRAVFVLVDILGHSKDQAGAILQLSASSVASAYRRAEQGLDNYLGVRCQHVAPANACRCESRLGVALERGFVGWPERPDELPDSPVFSNSHSSVAALYGSLPGFTMEDSEKAALLGVASV